MFFIFGLFIGSFLNTLAIRLINEEKFIFGRSRCLICQKVLKWYELIPLISFFLQKGKCRNCGAKISWLYPLGEILTGFFLSFLAWRLSFFGLQINKFDFWYYFVFYGFLFSVLYVLSLIDLKTLTIPASLAKITILGWVILALVKHIYSVSEIHFSSTFYYFFPSLNFLQEKLSSALLGFFIFLIIYLITFKKAIGYGDVIFAFILGLFLPPADLILSFLLAFIFASLFSLPIILKTGFKRQPIPFLPFLFLGSFATILIGELLINNYFLLFS